MKKYNLFKILGIVVLAYFILTWILPASYYSGTLTDLGVYPMSIPMLFQLPIQTLGYFSSTFVFILSVGSLYGVLEATGLYRKALDLLAKKMSKDKLVWLLVIAFVVTVISSLVGLELGMFLIFPFLVSLIILMGYDKLIALAATLGATIVGMFGSTYSYTLYGVTNSLLGTKMTDGILMKVILLVLGFGLLVGFILLYLKRTTKKVKVNKDKIKEKAKSKIAEKTEAIESALEKFIPVAVKEEKKKTKKVWPIILVLSIVLVIFMLGTLNWSEAFGIKWFNTAYSSVMGVDALSKLLSGIAEFGTWSGPTRFLYYTGIVILATIALAIIYRVKFNDYLKAMFEGAKGYLKTAALIMLSYSILVIVSSYPIFLTVAKVIVGEKFNVATTGIATILGSGLYVDPYYYPQYVLEYFASLSNANMSILNVLFVSLSSVVMLVAPTSTLLLASLSTFETKYKDWVKFIGILSLALVALAFIVLIVFTLV